MKQCRSCGVEKPDSEFHKKQSRCKPCKKEIDRQRYLKDRTNYYFRTYGITEADYDAMLEKQNNRCAICNKHQIEDERRFVIDHCHHTGKVRGLLCDNCNTGIGKLKDDPKLLDAAAEYLRATEYRL